MSLTDDQRASCARARAVLSEKRHAYDPESMAAHIGRLEFWLRDILALVDQLDDQLDGLPPATVANIARKHAG